MTPVYDNIEKIKAFSLGIWLITFLVMAFGFRFIREAVVFVLMKLYEFFIQHNPMH